MQIMGLDSNFLSYLKCTYKSCILLCHFQEKRKNIDNVEQGAHVKIIYSAAPWVDLPGEKTSR